MKEIKRYLESRIGEYSFYFEDLNGGYVYGYNENVKMVAAGCMKLPVAITLLKEVENGVLTLNDKVKVDCNDKVAGTGIIHEFCEREYTLLELLLAMLIQSDNTAANKIIDVIGISRINEIIELMGLKNTRLNRKTRDEKFNSNDIENLTSSYDLCMCWKHLYNHSFLNEEHSNKLIDILKRQQIKNKIAFYIPEGIRETMANKTGDSEGVENDTALIQTSKGNFAFTMLSKGIPNNVYGNVTLAKCGKMMWDMINNSWN